MPHRIIINDLEIPRKRKVTDEIKWICNSLGFSSGRDIEDTSFKIMNELLLHFKKSEIVSSEELSKSLKLDTPCINHHLRNFVNSGVIIREKRKVALRGRSLTSAIEEIQKDCDRMFEKIIAISKEIDKEFKFY